MKAKLFNTNEIDHANESNLTILSEDYLLQPEFNRNG